MQLFVNWRLDVKLNDCTTVSYPFLSIITTKTDSSYVDFSSSLMGLIVLGVFEGNYNSDLISNERKAVLRFLICFNIMNANV